MNILLVEDEPPILRELEHYIKKFGEPYHIIATAADGQKAMELIDKYQTKIDYLLTDIQIPMVNGLELVEYVKSRYPSIICSILSGYNDFSYVQKALRLKILDYILKPIEEEVLQNQLKDAYESKCLDYAKSEIITGYTANSSFSQELSLNYRQLLINIGQFSYKSDQYLEEKTANVHFKTLESTLRLFWNQFIKYWIIRDKNCHTYFVLFSFNKKQLENCNTFFRSLYDTLSHKFPMVTVICSEEQITLDTINPSIQKLSKYTDKKILFAKSSFMQMNSIENKTDAQVPEYSVQIDNIMQLSKHFLNGNRNTFHTELKHFIKELELKPVKQKTLGIYLLTLFTECTVPYLHYDSVQKIEPYNIVNDVLMLSVSYESLYANLISIFDDILATIINETGNIKDKSTTFLQINDYIKKHYTDTINTKIIADKFGFTPAYLSKLFREYKKITPSEYISELRINKAKELLTNNSSLSVKEVAAAAGYEDQLYFSKVFKKLVGITPKAYQLGQDKSS
ncbi:helix-turn-helix domain-containing protein [Anaerocolumna sp. AGMB13025]|uniref:response regulator transcription factor n=1 Tax=Anaerocolumna sp. AGMB13025 TaxID=3039116 RepID=UPI0024204D7B|nr:helix-turn-helix domain-containing protein [Anaerocolumna sp. AGMB13025]WFR57297.1 helix-turn-helix domain-containing protein [Anaerocolumna sp. AGMB13025]